MATESPRTAPRRSAAAAAAAAAKDGGAADLLSPRFRSAAALAGWDEESILLASLVVEDTPVRESRRKRRSSSAGGSSAGGSAGSNTRKRRSRRQSPGVIPPVVLALDDEEKPDGAAVGKEEEEKAEEKVAAEGKKEASGSIEKADANSGLPCMERLREELSCAICLEICFEPSTTPCGHSFCMKCIKHAASKCGKRCPKCRQLISNSRTCTVNTVLWNTIQLLFPSEVEARRASIASPSSASKDDVKQSQPRSTSFTQGRTRSRNTRGSFITQDSTISSSSNDRNVITRGSRRTVSIGSGFIGTRTTGSTGGFVRASQLVATTRSPVESVQSDAELAYRLQQEEFMTAFDSEAERQPPPPPAPPRNTALIAAFESEAERQPPPPPPPPRNTVSTARENLRAMASRAIRLRARGWPV